jgi:2-methylcitrate dehydratase PrpD
MEQPITPVPLRRELAHFIHDFSFAKLPDNVIHQAKRCLLDLIGVGIAGSRQNTAAIVRRLIPTMSGSRETTLWGSDTKVSVLTAVFMNAVQGHAIDMDDGHRSGTSFSSDSDPQSIRTCFCAGFTPPQPSVVFRPVRLQPSCSI